MSTPTRRSCRGSGPGADRGRGSSAGGLAAVLLALSLPGMLAAAEAGASSTPSPTARRPADDAVPALLEVHGRRIAGAARLDGASIVVDGSAVELPQMIALDYPGSVPLWLDSGVVLANGDIIRGVMGGLGAETLEFTSDMDGAMAIPVAALAAVILAPVRLADAVPDPAATAGAILANGDHLNGTLRSIADGHLGLDTGRRVVEVPLHRVRMVILRAPSLPTEAHQAVRLANGDRRSGALTALTDASVSLRLASGTLTLPTRLLRSLWNEGGTLTPLTAFPALAALAAPATLPTTQPPSAAMPAPSADRDGDGWIMEGGRRIEHGLVLDAGGAARFALDGQRASFIAEVALAAPGAAEAQVLVDGTVAFDSGAMNAADLPRPVVVRLTGAHALELLVTRVHATDAAGAAVAWAWPTVER